MTKNRKDDDGRGASPDQLLGAGVTHVDARDWDMLHYATGILVGLGSKYGVVDVTIYHNSIRVRIERVDKEEP